MSLSKSLKSVEVEVFECDGCFDRIEATQPGSLRNHSWTEILIHRDISKSVVEERRKLLHYCWICLESLGLYLSSSSGKEAVFNSSEAVAHREKRKLQIAENDAKFDAHAMAAAKL